LTEDDSAKALAQTREAAIRLLARREHSQLEIVRKLGEKGFGSEHIQQTLTYLQENDYQSETRFVEMWCRARSAKLYGEARIRNELAQHQISSSLINKVLADLQLDWFELCKQAFLKKYPGGISSDWTLQQKQKRYLWQRGFNEEQISYARENDDD